MIPLAAGAMLLDFGLKLWDSHKQSQAQAKQRKLQERQQQLSEQEYYSRQARIQDWNEKYGSIEHNMLSYVKGLDSSKIYGQKEGGISRMFENTRKAYDSHLADRGFDVAGGVHAEMFSALADQEVTTKLDYQQKAEQYVQQQRQAVLQPQPQVTSTVGMQQGLANQSNLIGQQANQNAAMLDSIGTTLGQYAGYQSQQSQQALNDKLTKAKIEAINRASTAYTPTAKEV